MQNIPTIFELNESIEADLRSKLNLSEAEFKTVFSAITAVFSAQFKLVNLYLSDIQNNIFPDTADLISNGGTLERLGQIYLGRNPNPATIGVFEIELTGVDAAVLREGITFKANEDSKSPGKLFVLDSEYILTSGVDIVEIRALGGGTDFDLDLLDNLTITEPVIGVEQTVSVTSVLTQPTASESIENYRKAILDAIQLEPQGGAKTDYRLWSADAPGVRRVYPYVRSNNAGIVDVFVEATLEDSTDGDGTPSAALLQSVSDVIELDPDTTKPIFERGRRPIQAIVETQSIVLIPVDVTITGLNDNTTSVQNAIETNLKTYLRNIRPYIDGADLPRDKNDILYSARLQSVLTDVLESSNFYSGFSLLVNGNTEVTYEFAGANIPYLRNLIFN